MKELDVIECAALGMMFERASTRARVRFDGVKPAVKQVEFCTRLIALLYRKGLEFLAVHMMRVLREWCEVSL
ncbi:hypothetical protein J5X91_17345 [Pseudoalteromonas sp. K222D]|uniref:hypothetical protein n=1 Tax=Pseudoalteromonas sp. K222D TaxID=2820756 RepID=UPI001AD793DB|nr:hypothetical protein [Pseudoalteromonas sp. K222D]MBO7928009.1 hypothetical protein [Pseudoalteromonas sp. K222D]